MAQQSALPTIGFLSSGSPRAFAKFLTAFQQGLTETGFVEGRNVSLVYRWAEGHFDELDKLAAELAARPVDLIAATGGLSSALAAKKATQTIPIVAVLGFDPVKVGLAASFNRPGGNFTGTTIITTEMAPKRLSLLYELDPGINKIAVLVNPAASSCSPSWTKQWNRKERAAFGRGVLQARAPGGVLKLKSGAGKTFRPTASTRSATRM